jgi:ATP-dependent Clp protease ATP-binding subunit ClpA
MLSFDLQLILQKATEKAAKENHEFVTLEHLLEQFCLSQEGDLFFKWSGLPMQPVLIETQEVIEKNCPIKVGSQPELTMAVHRCINLALNQAQAAGKSSIQAANVLIAFFEEDDSFASYILSQNNIDPLLLMDFLTENAEENGETISMAQKYTVDLNAVLANAPHPLIGRTEELKSLYRTLLRKQKNHCLIIGASGVGKTAFVKGFVQAILDETVPEALKKVKVHSLELGALMAGTKYRGDLEARVESLFKELEQQHLNVVFIDEIHNLVGAGRTSGSSSDLSNLLKPFLENSKIRFIGVTTPQDFRKNMESDPTFVRRFQKLDLEEPSFEECTQIVDGLLPSYEAHHEVKYEPKSVELSIRLSGKHMHERKWPDKALDVLDEAGSMTRLLGKKKVTTKNIEKVVAQMAKIPEETAEQDEVQLLKNLESKIKSKIFGQDKSIQELVASIQYSRSGLGPKQGPIGSFLFTGPTGVGKTEVSRTLAENLGVKFIKFDMSEYMEKHSVSKLIGAPPGYVGYDEGGQLTATIRETPHAVLLLDEIEKAHPDLLNVLLQVMDSGTLTDSQGKLVNFSNVIIIMTSNLGAREANKNQLGIVKSAESRFTDEAVKRFFAPEFVNRLTSIIRFEGLAKAQLLDVITKFLNELKAQVLSKGFELEWDKSVEEFIFEKGYDPLMGARPFQRTINTYVKKILVGPLLFNKLESKVLKLSVNDEEIKLQST